MTKVKIFLSHASEDKDQVRGFYAKLQRDGYEVWLDEEILLPGQEWRKEISKAVRETDVVLVFVSRHLITKTGFIQDEIALALNEVGKRTAESIFVIPVLLEDCSIPQELSRWHAVKLSEDSGYRRLLRSLAKVQIKKDNEEIQAQREKREVEARAKREKNEEEARARETRYGTGVWCPNCAAQSGPQAFCWYCGTALSVRPTVVPPPSSSYMPAYSSRGDQGAYCSNCGTHSDNKRFCHTCGSPISR